MGGKFGIGTSCLVILIGLIQVWRLEGVSGHGRLIEPPSRSSMWRYGFNTTANYNDHELYCGGFARQHQKNGGKCGVCGDPWDGSRANEAGGPYAQGIIVRKYRKNSIIRIKVELTANHKGYFEFRICPNNNPKKRVSQACLDTYVLRQANGEGSRYPPGEGTKVFESRYLLPKGMTCTQCVLQWRYIAANSWGGPCPDGSPEGLGCGPQEEFRACSDVAIYDDKGYASSEEPDIPESGNENEVGIDKLEGGRNTTREDYDDDEYHSSLVWPFIMALIAFIMAILGFGFLFWWFYRQEITDFVRESASKINWGRKHDHSYPPSLHTRRVGGGPGIISENIYSTPIPVPPPRTKNKFQSPPDIYNQRKQITPDVISQPMQVTINGFPVHNR